MNGKEPVQRRAGNIGTAAKEFKQPLSYDRNRSGHFGAHSRSKIGKLIPGKKVSCKTETQRYKKKDHAGYPGYFTGPPIRPHKKHAYHVQYDDGDEHVCRPTMNIVYKPSEIHFIHDILYTFERFFSRRPVIEKKQYAGYKLYDKQEERHTSQVVPYRMLVYRYFFFVEDIFYSGKVQALIQPGE